MKRLIPFILIFLLLTACGARNSHPDTTVPENAPTQEEPASEETTPETEPSTEAITPESLKTEYEAAGVIVREILPYKGDYLVYCGTEPFNGSFQWVYTETGLRAPLLFSGWEVLGYEILQPGQIRVLVGGGNVFNGSMRAFPVYEYATACLPLTQTGKVIEQDSFGSGRVQREPYWAPVAESHTFGWGHGPVALVDVRVTAGGIEAVFGPTADNLGGFFAAASSIPVTKPTYDEATHTLTLRFRSTALSSGTAEFTDETERLAYEDLANICHLPTVFPAGTIDSTNDFISRAEVREEGEDTLLILSLTDAAEQYTVETGQLLKNESRPYLHLSLRDTWKY